MNSIKNVEKIKSLSVRIKEQNFGDDENELSLLISELEKLSRKEKSVFYSKYFNDMDFALLLVSLAVKYSTNTNLVINVVSLLGNMIRRYGLSPSDPLFNFFFDLRNTKKVNYYVSLFITTFPQFKQYESRLDYIISMINIAPKAKSERNFYLEVKRIIVENEILPEKYKNKLISIFESFLKQDINETYKIEYEDMIQKICRNK